MSGSEKFDIIGLGREVLEIEAKALSLLPGRLGEDFQEAVKIFAARPGRIVVTGIGKAGLVGRKISATLASTGSPSIWLHPAEALHGDLGVIGPDDAVLALSNSGESYEIKALLPFIREQGIPLVAITGSPKSSLAQAADITLDASVEKEACPDNLAPTASTTAAMALGDAMALCLKELRGFSPTDFARLHPAGAIGKRLLARVGDLMRTGEANPVVGEDLSVKEVILAITKARAGAASVIDSRGRLAGIFTDGDLRRRLETDPDLLDLPVSKVMTVDPVTVSKEQMAVEALQQMRARRIDEIPVIDEDRMPLGMLDVQDLLSAGIV